MNTASGPAGFLAIIALPLLAVGACQETGREPIHITLEDTCEATDGDTLRCGAERIRLIGMDAPEMPGHCRAGRRCATGDPYLSKHSLHFAIEGEPIEIERMGQDRYGRTLAHVYVALGETRINLACVQLGTGMATYRANWDNLPAGRTARECGL